MPACGGRCPIAHYCLDLGHDDGDDDDDDDNDGDDNDDDHNYPTIWSEEEDAQLPIIA